MPRGRRGVRGGRHVFVVDPAKVQRINNNIVNKERLRAYMTIYPQLAIQLWNNPIIVDKLDANPALLDELNENPEMRVPQFIQENPPPPPPPSKCCSIV